MVGQPTATKPSRSDEVLDENQQLQIASQIRAQFDSLAPKRPTKPNRSEPAETTIPNTSAVSDSDQNHIPELDKLRSLRSQSPPVLFSDKGTNVERDEFVETQYYKELDSVDKQHHMTGQGFIRMASENEHGYGIQSSSSGNGGGALQGTLFSGFRSNPATNDWTPCLEENQVFLSSKPNRSEGCSLDLLS
ncbi:hypothetical protein Tsubulata_024469 [Turnera subulata]|uniref:Maternal effect embryo arrest 59 n=1 Tax=Turnera subulata TaxID=218843 RepID=A0A9Q0FNA7_9ROSI|nr:hypothetical protein Tsubulata_024469 [Turnera subulata]